MTGEELSGIPQSRRGRGIGTGFIINQRGHILTNAHVVENASQVMVQLHDGTELSAEIVAVVFLFGYSALLVRRLALRDKPFRAQ